MRTVAPMDDLMDVEHMANTQKYINHLLQNGASPAACSEEERACADELAHIFANHGFDPVVQDFKAAPSKRFGLAVMGIMAFVGSVLMGVGGIAGVLGFLLALAAAVLYVLDRFGYRTLTKLGPGGYSQNVIAYHKATGPLASPRNRPVVVVAHYDTPHADLLSKQPVAQYRDLIFKMAPICTVAPGAIAIVRLLPLPGALSVLLWIVAILVALVPLAVAISYIARRFFMPTTSGAICNKSSVAAMLGVMDAVSPYAKGEEFPQDLDFDTYMAEQKRRAEEEALAAAAAYGYADEYDDVEADADAAGFDEASGENEPVESAEGESAEPSDGEEWPAPELEGEPSSATSVLSNAANTVSSLFGSIKNRAEEAGGAASWIRDHIPSREADYDATEVPAAEPYPFDDSADAQQDIAAGDAMLGAAPAQQVEPAAANDPFAGLDIVAPVGDEAEAAEQAEEKPLRNDAGAIRYGLDVVKSLGMLPADCEIEYEAGAMPAQVAKRTAAVVEAVEPVASAVAPVPESAPAAAPAPMSVDVPEVRAEVDPAVPVDAPLDPSRSQVFPAQPVVPEVEQVAQGVAEVVPAAVEQATLVEPLVDTEPAESDEPVDVEPARYAEDENATPRPLAHEGEGTFADPFAPVHPLPIDEEPAENEVQAAESDGDLNTISEAPEHEGETSALDQTSTVMAPLPIDAALPEYRPQTTYEDEGDLDLDASRKFDISVVTEVVTAFGAKIIDAFTSLVERAREMIAHFQENRRAREAEMLEEQKMDGAVEAAAPHDDGLIPIDDAAAPADSADDEDAIPVSVDGVYDSEHVGMTGMFDVPADPVVDENTENTSADDGSDGNEEIIESADERVAEDIEPAERAATELPVQADATAVFPSVDVDDSQLDEVEVAAETPVSETEQFDVEDAAVAEVDVAEEAGFEAPAAGDTYVSESLETITADEPVEQTAQFDSPFISADFKIPTDEPASASVRNDSFMIHEDPLAVPEASALSETDSASNQPTGLEFEDLFAAPSQLDVEDDVAAETVSIDDDAETTDVPAAVEDERDESIAPVETDGESIDETVVEASVGEAPAEEGETSDDPVSATEADDAIEPEPVQEVSGQPAPANRAPEKKFSTQIFTMPAPERETDTVDSLMAEITGSFNVNSTQSQPVIQPPSGNPTAAAKIMPPVPVISSGMKPVLRSVPDPSMPSLRQGSTVSRASLFDLPDPATNEDPFASESSSAGNGRSPQQRDPEDYGDFPAPAAEAPSKKKRGLAGLFGRKKKQETSSMSDWLGVDEDFDAKNSGRGIGSWDNFEDDDWKGGATSSEGATEAEMVSAVTSMGDDELLGHDIWFVAAGASDYDGAGTQAFLDEYRDKLRGVFVINLESVGSGHLATVAAEGSQRVLRGDRRIAGLVNKVASAFHTKVDTVTIPQVETDAYAAMQMSLRALTITGIDGQGQRIAGTDEDIPANVSLENIDMVSEIVTEVIRRS